MYRYETHLHTWPVSRCARASVRESMEFYKTMGFAGVFVTNHFLDGNINIDRNLPYADRIRFYYSDYEAAVEIGRELDIAVFDGVEMSYEGIDFLVYGISKEWFLAHPEIEGMRKTELLALLMAEGALVIQAHPFRESDYIDHIQLFPRSVQGVEVYNACRTEEENAMAVLYADHYGLLHFHGTDNHMAGKRTTFGGMESETPLKDTQDFVHRFLKGEMMPFRLEL